MAVHTPATPPVKLVPAPQVVTVTTSASSPTAVTVSLAMPPAPEIPWYEAAELTAVRDNLRHASIATTSIYLHSDDVKRARQMAAVFSTPDG